MEAIAAVSEVEQPVAAAVVQNHGGALQDHRQRGKVADEG
jgi:hypothetical protein